MSSKRFSTWFVRNHEEFAGCIEGGWACPLGWVRSSDGQETEVHPGDSVAEIKAEMRAAHKAAQAV